MVGGNWARISKQQCLNFGINGDPLVRVGHLCLIPSLALGGSGLGVVPHPYYARKFGIATVHAVARLTMSPGVYSWLETSGALGTT